MSVTCDLKSRHCKPCESRTEPLTGDAVRAFLADLQGWDLSEDGREISRRFEFRGFFRTMAFVNAMAWVAQQEDHHPDFTVGYNCCVVGFTTHAVGGLSENDFICAAKVAALID